MSSEADEWLELSSLAEQEAVEALSEAFSRWGQGVAIEQPVVSSGDGDVVSLPIDAPVVVKTYVPLGDPTAGTRRQHIEQAVWALGKLRQVGPLTVRTLREEDWANAWKEHFFIHRVGRRTAIVPTWRVDDYVALDGEIVLLLDPGMAFGTGLHPTTRLCLSVLEDAVRPGSRVLDLGTGSGLLAIAAAKLGAAHVDAVEIDPVAVRVCRANVERNGVEHVVATREGTLSLAADRDSFYDLAVANISIRVLLELHEALASHLRPGALAVLSGVLVERELELVDVLQAAGWQHETTAREQDWVAVTMRAPHGR